MATDPRSRPSTSTAAAAASATTAGVVPTDTAQSAPPAPASSVTMETTTTLQRETQQPQVSHRDNLNNNNINNRIINSREQEQIERRKRNIVVKGLYEDLSDGDQGGVHRMLDTLGLGFLKGRDCWTRRVGKGSNDRPRLLVVAF